MVKILGGLGNQMFQYAFAYALSKKKGAEIKLDISGFKAYDLRAYELNLFDISLEIAKIEEANRLKYKEENLLQKIVRKVRRKGLLLSDSYYREPHFNFDEKVFDLENVYCDGYWQSEKYFKEYRYELLKEFTLKKDLSKQSQVYKNEIVKTESVSLHIRRGDYVTNEHTNSVHGTCSLAYYREAILLMKSKLSNPSFYIFSDDLQWARKNFNFIENITIIELDKEIPDHEEMMLMSLCKHNIIANSSFSWWGAWLNQNPNKMVIAPFKWFNDTSKDTSDLIPEIWICL